MRKPRPLNKPKASVDDAVASQLATKSIAEETEACAENFQTHSS